jgi:uncharacterized protein YoxC
MVDLELLWTEAKRDFEAGAGAKKPKGGGWFGGSGIEKAAAEVVASRRAGPKALREATARLKSAGDSYLKELRKTIEAQNAEVERLLAEYKDAQAKADERRAGEIQIEGRAVNRYVAACEALGSALEGMVAVAEAQAAEVTRLVGSREHKVEALKAALKDLGVSDEAETVMRGPYKHLLKAFMTHYMHSPEEFEFLEATLGGKFLLTGTEAEYARLKAADKANLLKQHKKWFGKPGTLNVQNSYAQVFKSEASKKTGIGPWAKVKAEVWADNTGSWAQNRYDFFIMNPDKVPADVMKKVKAKLEHDLWNV